MSKKLVNPFKKTLLTYFKSTSLANQSTETMSIFEKYCEENVKALDQIKDKETKTSKLSLVNRHISEYITMRKAIEKEEDILHTRAAHKKAKPKQADQANEVRRDDILICAAHV